MAAILFGGPVTMKRQRFVTNSVFKNGQLNLPAMQGAIYKVRPPIFDPPHMATFHISGPTLPDPRKKDFSSQVMS